MEGSPIMANGNGGPQWAAVALERRHAPHALQPRMPLHAVPVARRPGGKSSHRSAAAHSV
ncbi:MAG TPA: hypothetical protein VFK04_12195 [Gemmatimonadaceae bacterium]|nr:hypothetical protein [Gemmatimonadaceae bacterium]